MSQRGGAEILGLPLIRLHSCRQSMSDFQYIARGQTGQQVTGVLSAGSEQEALSKLAGRSLFPVQLELAPEAASRAAETARRVRAKHLALTYSQLADLAPLRRAAVTVLGAAWRTRRSMPGCKEVLQTVRADVAEGTRLGDAMRKHPKVFSELAVSMVRAGEEGAFVEDVLKRIADFTDHQEMLKSRVTGAMVYPGVPAVMGTVVVIAMLTFFVPKFTPIFDRMSTQGQPARGDDVAAWRSATRCNTTGLSSCWRVGGACFTPMRWSQTDRRTHVGSIGMRLVLFGDRTDFSQLCDLAVLPHPGNAVAQRRADSRIAADRQGRDGKPRAQRGDRHGRRKRLDRKGARRSRWGSAASFPLKSWK